MSYLVFSCSLKADSNSRRLAHMAYERLNALEVPAELIDLREWSLPFCDAGDCYGHPHVTEMAGKVAAAKGILLATPIYNYDVSATAKNLLELTGSHWQGKTVGFLCAAGGRRSYMSVMAFANSLMLDFRCLVVPRFVYADDAVFAEPAQRDRTLAPRVAEVCKTLVALAPVYRTVAPTVPSPTA